MFIASLHSTLLLHIPISSFLIIIIFVAPFDVEGMEPNEEKNIKEENTRNNVRLTKIYIFFYYVVSLSLAVKGEMQNGREREKGERKKVIKSDSCNFHLLNFIAHKKLC